MDAFVPGNFVMGQFVSAVLDIPAAVLTVVLMRGFERRSAASALLFLEAFAPVSFFLGTGKTVTHSLKKKKTRDFLPRKLAITSVN